MSPTERADRHSRQLRLPWLGERGQARLAGSKVLIVGCGGLGATVIAELAAAGIGQLHLVDDDCVERSNLNRQVLHRTCDIGRHKAERAAEWVQALDPTLRVEADFTRLGPHNTREYVRSFDLVMDCTDGLPTKFLLNDACVLENTPLVHGAASGLEGQVLWMPGAAGPCLRCLFAGIPPAGSLPNCQVAGVLGATCAMVGSMMSLEAIFFLAGRDRSAGRFILVDAQTIATREMRFAARADCDACSECPALDARSPEDYVAATERSAGA